MSRHEETVETHGARPPIRTTARWGQSPNSSFPGSEYCYAFFVIDKKGIKTELVVFSCFKDG
jgi:hypothetical protein